MNRRKALLQLRIVQAVLRRERELGGVGPSLRERSAAIVEMTLSQMEPEMIPEDGEWQALLESIRSLMGADED